MGQLMNLGYLDVSEWMGETAKYMMNVIQKKVIVFDWTGISSLACYKSLMEL